MRKSEFDDLRPYYDEEVNEALRRIVSDPLFPQVAQFLFPDRPLDELKEVLLSCEDAYSFQHNVMNAVIGNIVKKTTAGFTYEGLDALDKDKAYLFVSNHRDIMLDAALLQYLLDSHDLPTTEITFGANLMVNQFVVDIGKCNRMFKVARPGANLREFYERSIHLSEYMRYTLAEKKASIWIAQRNGRTKDGNDLTDQGIIQMFGMSKKGDKVKSLAELNIVPISISYEWEPCDTRKARELFKRLDGYYKKQPGEDLDSIVTGVTEQKGRVHMCICKPIEEAELEGLRGLKNTDFHKAAAKLIDQRIQPSYRLFPNNYIACDLRSGSTEYADKYTDAQKAAFLGRFSSIQKHNSRKLEEIFLGIYANPVVNKLK